MARWGDATAGRHSYLRLAIHLQPEVPVNKYVIERSIPGVGSLDRDGLHAASTKSCGVLDVLGPDIQWVYSFVTDDKIYCVYLADNEQIIRDSGADESSTLHTGRIVPIYERTDSVTTNMQRRFGWQVGVSGWRGSDRATTPPGPARSAAARSPGTGRASSGSVQRRATSSSAGGTCSPARRCSGT